MIRDFRDFFGRKRELDSIFSNLTNFQNTSVIGERRAGKSSLLWHLTQAEVHTHYAGGNPKPFLFVFFDLQKIAIVDQVTFFRLLAESIVKRVPGGVTTAHYSTEHASEYFDEVVEIVSMDHRIVLCLDEFETLTVNDTFNSAFLLKLRSYANTSKVAYIISSREPLEEITKGTHHLQGSDFWNIFVTPSTYLGLLTEGEAVELITEPARRIGVRFTDSEIAFAQELGGLHPLFLQIACFHLFEQKVRYRQTDTVPILTAADREMVKESFVASAAPHFEHIWARLGQRDRALLVTPPGAEFTEDDMKTVKDLQRKGILLSAGTDIRGFSPAFQMFVERQSAGREPVVGTMVTQAAERFKSTVDQEEFDGVILQASRPTRAQTPVNTLDICIGRKGEVFIEFRGEFRLSVICQNTAKFDASTTKRFDVRARALPSNPSWRVEKQEIGVDVALLFDRIPELAQIYTEGRGRDGEELLITFKCPREMLSFPFEFLNGLAAVDETTHLAISHPLRKSIVNVLSRKKSLNKNFFRDPKARMLLVSSNVSGTMQVEGRNMHLSPIPGVAEEINAIDKIIQDFRADGIVRCQVEVRHNVTATEMRELVESGQFDAVHYSGHAFFADPAENSAAVFWQNGPGGEIEMITATEWKHLLGYAPIRFFYLSCCQGATTGMQDQLVQNDYLGLTDSFIHAGVPAVLSMRWPLDDLMAKNLAAFFYKELFKEVGLESALFRARKLLQSRHPRDCTWLSPILIVQDS
jgi:hypothetical protein